MGRATHMITLVGTVMVLAVGLTLGGFCCVESAESCHTLGTHLVRATGVSVTQVRSAHITMSDQEPCASRTLTAHAARPLRDLQRACASPSAPLPLRI